MRANTPMCQKSSFIKELEENILDLKNLGRKQKVLILATEYYRMCPYKMSVHFLNFPAIKQRKMTNDRPLLCALYILKYVCVVGNVIAIMYVPLV